jgi:unsaturated rhamnogalacturonyl hydrolase
METMINNEMKKLDALGYAKAACETMMRKFPAADLPPKGHFHYHQGVFLSGMMETWKECGDDRYFTFAKDWIDSVFDADGKIKNVSFADLDDIQPGILLFQSGTGRGMHTMTNALPALSKKSAQFRAHRKADGGIKPPALTRCGWTVFIWADLSAQNTPHVPETGT